jgi:hypothetical protein
VEGATEGLSLGFAVARMSNDNLVGRTMIFMITSKQ